MGSNPTLSASSLSYSRNHRCLGVILTPDGQHEPIKISKDSCILIVDDHNLKNWAVNNVISRNGQRLKFTQNRCPPVYILINLELIPNRNTECPAKYWTCQEIACPGITRDKLSGTRVSLCEAYLVRQVSPCD